MTKREKRKGDRGDVELVPFAALVAEPGVMAAVNRIFFAASARRQFASRSEREAFYERWLGRYLGADLSHGLLAVAGPGEARRPLIAGYLVGCLDDPAKDARFADIGYFVDFAELCREYPAHLHINLDEAFRGRGIGSAMVGEFASHAAAAGAGGMHVVTSPVSRNLGFYNRLGFEDLARIGRGDKEVVFLGRHLN